MMNLSGVWSAFFKFFNYLHFALQAGYLSKYIRSRIPFLFLDQTDMTAIKWEQDRFSGYFYSSTE